MHWCIACPRLRYKSRDGCPQCKVSDLQSSSSPAINWNLGAARTALMDDLNFISLILPVTPTWTLCYRSYTSDIITYCIFIAHVTWALWPLLSIQACLKSVAKEYVCSKDQHNKHHSQLKSVSGNTSTTFIFWTTWGCCHGNIFHWAQ